MLKAVIFDLNGIFLLSEKLSQRFERDYGISSNEFWQEMSKIMDEVRKPDAKPSFSFWEPLFTKWMIPMTEQEFWDYWFGAEEPSQEMVNVARELKSKGLKIFLLSNNFRERAEYYGHYDWIADVVDKTYYSWQTGFVKPDVMAWKNLLEENQLKSEECLYFDDQEKNVQAAESVGIKSFMFKDSQTTKQIIEQHINV